MLKPLAAAAFALALTACGTPGILAPNEPAHISKVQVSLKPGVSSERFAELLRARAALHAARFGNAGAPKELRIFVNQHSYKNAAMSLLVGDANFAGGRVAVIDVASGQVQGEVDAGAFDTLAINGIAGAIIAAAQDKQKVDERLADGLAKAALRMAYGTARATPVIDRGDPPAAAPEQPGQAPAPNGNAKDVPVAATAKGKTAAADPAATPPANRSAVR